MKRKIRTKFDLNNPELMKSQYHSNNRSFNSSDIKDIKGYSDKVTKLFESKLPDEKRGNKIGI